ncbi:MAG: hypothetical protein JWR88_158 [Pseudonocardia sp.]|nr:hypothetical protein [Pseudonocardia sp.]
MATWIDLVGYVRTRYEVMRQTDDSLTFNLPLGGERTQIVYVHHVQADGDSWVQIESPIAKADDIDLRRLLELAGATVVGGAGVVEGTAVYQHAVPLNELQALSLSAFDKPFQLVVKVADQFERELTGSDTF